MRRQLADGELRAVALLGNGTLAPVRSDAWVVDENFSQWFSACQITNFALFGSGIHPLAGVTYHWLFVDRAGLDSIVGSARIAPGIEAFPADRGLRGRRPAYDWPAFDAEATSKLEEEGAFNPAVDANWNKAALERHMQEWCAKNWGKEPGESTIRDKLTKVEADFVAGRKSQ
ncbi:hypothetical protein SAMN04488498_11394 [Mesorhizobium albiziae]|uniref:Uncharacterized protein n=2 Tax=Neomesorhizobium albiziae TaxID=335020 RepID=A0A1I4CIS6_9HYPH|nr:hypothetical protein GCM10007937_09990 [Mesorhizobium albiziae]SFK81138.1 hypothetical protein SAMN04488498_11394 [Mesorhizobium albiziae]